MTLVSWLIVAEAIIALGLIIWLINKAHKHVKHSPAEKALREHLVELESVKAAKLDLRKIPVSSELSRSAKTDFSVVDVPTGTSSTEKIGFSSPEASSGRDEVLRKPSKKELKK